MVKTELKLVDAFEPNPVKIATATTATNAIRSG